MAEEEGEEEEPEADEPVPASGKGKKSSTKMVADAADKAGALTSAGARRNPADLL